VADRLGGGASCAPAIQSRDRRWYVLRAFPGMPVTEQMLT
jgi:hypothetical protein